MVEGIKMLTIGTTSLIAGQSCSCQVGNIPSLWLTILPRVAFLPSSVRQWLPASDLWDCSGNPIPSGQSWRLSSWTLDVYDVLVCVCVFFRKRNYEERPVLYLLHNSKFIPSKNLQQRYRLQGLGGQVFEFGTSISSHIWRGRRHYPKYCRWGHLKLRSLRVQNCEWCFMMFFPMGYRFFPWVHGCVSTKFWQLWNPAGESMLNMMICARTRMHRRLQPDLSPGTMRDAASCFASMKTREKCQKLMVVMAPYPMACLEEVSFFPAFPMLNQAKEFLVWDV